MLRNIWSRAMQQLLRWGAVIGPGVIVMVADNDAGAVGTYTEAGAHYGPHLLWLLILLLPVTYFIQEMAARLGIVTGQGHAAMIYKRFGRGWGLYSIIDLLAVNFLTLVTEFALINLVATHLGISPYVSVPLVAGGLIWLVVSSSYHRWERATLLLCALDLGWLWVMFRTIPDIGHAVSHTFVPVIPPGGITSSLMFLIVAIVGTTIAPWQLFFQQSCVADKKLRFADLKYERLDTAIGALVVVGMAGCMMLVGSAMDRVGAIYQDPGQMADALSPLIGWFASKFLLLLMCNAAILGCTAISLSSAWAYGEVKGWKHSIDSKFSDAPRFYLALAAFIALAAAITLIPQTPLQLVILMVQVFAGMMLPSAVIFMQLLLNDKELLGDQYSNSTWNNWVNWIIIVVLFALSLLLVTQVILPGGGLQLG